MNAPKYVDQKRIINIKIVVYKISKCDSLPSMGS